MTPYRVKARGEFVYPLRWFPISSLPCPVKQELQTPGSQAGAWEPAKRCGSSLTALGPAFGIEKVLQKQKSIIQL